ncbi:retrotransposon protein, putative, ty1-copia subclass [Tanacetum coccineum]
MADSLNESEAKYDGSVEWHWCMAFMSSFLMSSLDGGGSGGWWWEWGVKMKMKMKMFYWYTLGVRDIRGFGLASGRIRWTCLCEHSAIPRDGIFEINLSNSYENESSIYTVSNKRAKLDLDSALLWHCRLGHVSKKRIEKLQHDGLLNSTDLRAFEKYVHCISGKMARKPYTRQVERAKDLLGLIHTDV